MWDNSYYGVIIMPKYKDELGQFIAQSCPHGIKPTRNCRECRREASRNHYQKHKDGENSRKKEYLRRNPEKRRAHNYVLYHKLPLASKCEFCLNVENLERHHPDYDYPEIFITCCSLCHSNADKTTEEI